MNDQQTRIRWLESALRSTLWVLEHPDVNAIHFCGSPLQVAKAIRGVLDDAPQAPAFDREGVEAVAACLGDDAAQLRQKNDEDERADNMDRAASMLMWMLLTHPAYAAATTKQEEGGAGNPSGDGSQR